MWNQNWNQIHQLWSGKKASRFSRKKVGKNDRKKPGKSGKKQSNLLALEPTPIQRYHHQNYYHSQRAESSSVARHGLAITHFLSFFAASLLLEASGVKEGPWADLWDHLENSRLCVSICNLPLKLCFVFVFGEIALSWLQEHKIMIWKKLFWFL